MRSLIFKITFILLTTINIMAHDGKKTVSIIVPQHSKLQYAGSMGLLSAGFGWSYGNKNNWETDVMFGYIPRYTTDKGKLCITIKENFIPWEMQLGNSDFFLEPLTSGFYMNTVLNENFWVKEPNKYPKSYYGFSSKIRFNICVGQRVSFKNPGYLKKKIKSISSFYEISCNDLYIISAFGNSNLKFSNFLHFSIGVGFTWM